VKINLSCLKTISLGALLIAGAVNAAPEPAKIGLIGGIVYSDPKVSENGTRTSLRGAQSNGGGLLAEFTLGGALGLETGAYVFDRRMETFQNGGNTYNLRGLSLNIPLLVRFYPLKIMSLGAGAYYGTTLGNLKGTGSTTAGDRNFTPAEAGVGNNDWGVAAAVGLDIPLSDHFGILGDVRYLLSAFNAGNTNTSSWRYRDLFLQAGLRYAF